MQAIKQAAAEFLANKRVAVTGVSRQPTGHGSNVVYQRLRQRGLAHPETDRPRGHLSHALRLRVPLGLARQVDGADEHILR